MNKRKAYLITAGVLLLLLLVLAILLYLGNRVPANPAGTVGNTAGNLNNSGLFCELDGIVYFSNPYDNNTLYSMTKEEQNLKKLNNIKVRNLLAAGEFLYYFHTGGDESDPRTIRSVKSFNRSKLNGNNTIGLTRDIVLCGQLVDNHLYLLTGDGEELSLVKLKIDKSEQEVLADYEINPACVHNSTIYYNGTQTNHYLYGLDTINNTTREILQENMWNPVAEGDYIYYMDVSHDYRLCRYSLSGKISEVLTNDRVDCFNVGGGYIYYQSVGEDAALKCMNTDGSNVKVIASGVYNSINMTSKYVYFKEYANDVTLYHTPLGGSVFEVFGKAKEAALAK